MVNPIDNNPTPFGISKKTNVVENEPKGVGMKSINVYYWGKNIPELEEYYPHNSVFDGNLVEVMTDIINRGYEVMTRHIDEKTVVLFVNRFGNKFSQR